ncbi:MAG: hypothetical protein ABSD46_08775 [Bacteroidota bacterium]
MINEKSRLNLNTTGLSEKMNLWAEELNMTATELVRKALSDFIDRLERNRREQELAEACRNYREFNKKFSSEWARYETRIK